MSWNNVEGISKFQIWAESSFSSTDGTETYLFVNGCHQVKVTVGLSLALDNVNEPGPTLDEVKQALQLINNQNGGNITRLLPGNKGAYTQVYDPNHSTYQSVLKASNFQYEVEFWFSSNVNINPGKASEEVSVKLTYTDTTGEVIVNDLSANGDYYQKGFVKVHCMPAKDNSSIFEIAKDPGRAAMDVGICGWEYSNLYGRIHRLRMKDSYFYINDYTISSNTWMKTKAGSYCLAMKTDQSSRGPKWQYNTHVYFPTHYLGMGKTTFNYTTHQYKNTDLNDDSYYSFVQFPQYTQDDHELVFVSTTMTIDHRDSTFSSHCLDLASFSIHDQFGNQNTVYLDFHWPETEFLQPEINNVV